MTRLFNILKTVHVLVMVATIIGALLFWLLLMRPALKQASREARYIADMLSQLPPEMDVEGLVAGSLLGGE